MPGEPRTVREGEAERPGGTAGVQAGQLQAALARVAELLFADARRLQRLAHLRQWSDEPAAGAPSVSSDGRAGLNGLTPALFGLEAQVAQLRGVVEAVERGLGEELGAESPGDEPLAEEIGLSRDAIIWVQEQERHRLAREIHDGPAQILSNAVMELEFCQRLLERRPDQLRIELPKLKDNLRIGLAEVRSFLFDLRPPALHDLGVAVSLLRYAQEFQSRFGIEVVLDIDCLEERLSDALEVTIFRIVQEALQNVQRHAGTKRVTVRCQKSGGALKLEIADEGRGFDPSELPEKHLGLVSMRERAQLAGGQFNLYSEPGYGTRITVTLPVSSQPERAEPARALRRAGT